MTIDCRKIQSITREKTAYVVPNAILICTDDEKVNNIINSKIILNYSDYKNYQDTMALSALSATTFLFPTEEFYLLLNTNNTVCTINICWDALGMGSKPASNNCSSTLNIYNKLIVETSFISGCYVVDNRTKRLRQQKS